MPPYGWVGDQIACTAVGELSPGWTSVASPNSVYGAGEGEGLPWSPCSSLLLLCSDAARAALEGALGAETAWGTLCDVPPPAQDAAENATARAAIRLITGLVTPANPSK